MTSIDPALRLYYCLNVHPGESWRDVSDAALRYAADIRRRVWPDRPMPLGLRISARAAQETSVEAAAAFRRQLQARGLFVRSVNAFPYGRFHRCSVKDQVYRPDWRSTERLLYTQRVAELLVALLPEGESGSISTVPIGWRHDPWAEEDARGVREHLREMARFLRRLEESSGRFIGLALEPEPDCLLESPEDVVQFWAEFGDDALVRRYIGCCVDTCHWAVCGHALAPALERLRAGEVPIFKIQVSAALVAVARADGIVALQRFADPVYLHQTFAFDATGRVVLRWPDLPEALALWTANPAIAQLRTHVHVPLHWAGDGALRSTVDALDGPFWRTARSLTDDLEVETYTWDVLPAELRRGGVIDGMARDLVWVEQRLREAVTVEGAG